METLPPPPGRASEGDIAALKARSMSDAAKIIVSKAEEIKKGADLLLVKGNAEDAITKVIIYLCLFFFKFVSSFM